MLSKMVTQFLFSESTILFRLSLLGPNSFTITNLELKLLFWFPVFGYLILSLILVLRHTQFLEKLIFLGYDQNQNIWPEPDPEFWFRLAGTGSDSENSGSGYTNLNLYAQIPVLVPAGYGPVPEVAKTFRKKDSAIIKGKIQCAWLG